MGEKRDFLLNYRWVLKKPTPPALSPRSSPLQGSHPEFVSSPVLKKNRPHPVDGSLFLVRETGLSSQLSKAPPALSPGSSPLRGSHPEFVSSPVLKKNRPHPVDGSLFLVRETGLEPVRLRHTHLKRACLPVPAFSQVRFSAWIIIASRKRKVKTFFQESDRQKKSIGSPAETHTRSRRPTHY